MKTKRICYYLRNSTEHQDYIYQKQALDDYFSTFKYVDFAGEYAEKVSGFKSENNRPEMNRLLQDVAAGLIDEIWCYDVARLSRDAINLQVIVRQCSEKGVNIYFKANNLYTLNSDLSVNDTTKLIVSILAQFAETDAKQLKSKLKAGKLTKNRMGNEYIGGKLTLGYKYTSDQQKRTKTITIDENRVELVRYIFHEYVYENKSLNQISNQLNITQNINPNFATDSIYLKLNSKNKKWSGTTLNRIIKNSQYICKKTINRSSKSFEVEHVQLDESLRIIDDITFEKAQRKLSTNKNRGTERKHTYLVKDLFFCGCGATMKVHQLTVNNTAKGNYICYDKYTNKFDKSVNCRHNMQSLKAETVDNAVWLMLKNKLPNFKIELANAAKKQNNITEKIDDAKRIIETIEQVELVELEAQKNRAIMLNVKHEVNVDSVLKEIGSRTEQLKKMIIEKTDEIQLLTIQAQNFNVADELTNNIMVIEGNKELMKQYMKKFIKRIEIQPGLGAKRNKLIKITWNVDGHPDNYVMFNSNLSFDSFFYSIVADNNVNWNPTDAVFEVITTTNDKIIFPISELTGEIMYYYMKSFTPDFEVDKPDNYRDILLKSQVKFTLGKLEIV